jgi:mRNA interferase MazF
MPNRWDIFRVDFGRPTGHEPGKERPALVISYDALNWNTPFVTVCPITSTRRSAYACEVPVPMGEGLDRDSIIQVQLIRTIDARRLRDQIGRLRDPVIQEKVQQSLLTLLGLGELGA